MIVLEKNNFNFKEKNDFLSFNLRNKLNLFVKLLRIYGKKFQNIIFLLLKSEFETEKPLIKEELLSTFENYNKLVLNPEIIDNLLEFNDNNNNNDNLFVKLEEDFLNKNGHLNKVIENLNFQTNKLKDENSRLIEEFESFKYNQKAFFEEEFKILNEKNKENKNTIFDLKTQSLNKENYIEKLENKLKNLEDENNLIIENLNKVNKYIIVF